MSPADRPDVETCFSERNPSLSLGRKATAEFAGSLMLMLAVAGSGLTAQHLFPSTPAFGLLVSAITNAGALVSLIVAFGAVSGGHFNPLITGLQWLSGERKLDCTLAYIAAQLMGCVAGALLANLMFGVDRQPPKSGPVEMSLVTSEILASAGLMTIVFACARSGRSETGPFAVGAWLAAAIVATPSSSYANPAVVLGALAAVGPVALSSTTALIYTLAEIAGALLSFLLISTVYPRNVADTRSPEGAAQL